MYTGKFKVKILAIVLLILPFSVLYAGQQYCLYDQEMEVPCFISESFSVSGNYGSNVYLHVDSGVNWRDITIEISSYVFGVTRIKNLMLWDPQTRVDIQAVNNELDHIQQGLGNQGSILAGQSGPNPGDYLNEAFSEINSIVQIPQNVRVKGINPGRKNPAVTVNFLVRVTGTITMHIENTGGKNSVRVSKGKLTKSYYNLKVDGTDISKNYYCCKSETDKGRVTKMKELNSDLG